MAEEPLQTGDRVLYYNEIYFFESNGQRFGRLYIQASDIGNSKLAIYYVRRDQVRRYVPAPPQPPDPRRTPSTRHPLSISDEETLEAINLIRGLRGLPPWTSF